MDYFPSSSAGTSSSVENSQKPSERLSGSSVLWAHLLRKDVLASPAKTDLPLPPLAPVNKSATSTRILLLDTQAHLQKFGQAVDDLTSKVEGAKHEIVTVKTLFKQDREVLMNDIVDRLNRSQLEIQKSISKPAQASKLEDFQKNLELRLESMDQRLNAIQMLHQTYSQALQNQTQALQSLQDQQSTIIGALTPLLPLLQTIPPQIESARNDLSESLSNLQSIQLTTLSSRKTSSSPSPSRKRTNSSSSSTNRKRRRVDENFAKHTVSTTTTISTSPTYSRNLLGSTQRHRIMTPIVHKQSQIKATYRQPLAELPLTNFRARPSSITNPHGPADIPEHISYLETPVIIPRTPLLRSSDNIARFRQGYVQPPLKQIIERSPTVSIADASSLHQPSSPQIAMTSVSKLPGAPHTIDSRSKFKPAAHAFARAPASTHGPSHLLSATKIVSNAQNLGHLTSLTSTNAALSTPIEPIPAPLADATTAIIESKLTDPGTVPLPPQTLRQRRSPFREGRRFIPLDDSDTSDDEQRQIGFL